MATLKTRDGVTLHYTDDGAGPPLVFISGWAMSGNWWQEQRRHFSRTHRVLVLDARAQGGSEMVTRGHRLSRLGDVLDRQADRTQHQDHQTRSSQGRCRACFIS